MTDPHDLVCVYNATNAAKAEMVRNLLEAEGIRATTGDTHNPFPGLSIAPAEVFVEQSNADAARIIIAEVELNHSDDSSIDDAASDNGEEFAEGDAGT